MKAYLNTDHYANINLYDMTFTVKKFIPKGEKAISHAPLNENMTLKELKNFIELQKQFLKE